ncbi:MAG TPA: NADH-quinone oxidoreductase subunit N [Actinomycetes bacterium]|nr:NADH-quinone oxidoreductase subunit N [Actinomycetes bacterium]
MSIQSIDFTSLAPPMALAVGALVVLVVDLFVPKGSRVPGVLALVASVVAAGLMPATSGDQTLCVEQSCGYAVNALTLSLQAITIAATVVVVLMSMVSVKDARIPAGEYFFLLLCSASGAMLVAATTDLVSLVVALELVSLPTFALIGLNTVDRRAGEAALKAFLFSVASVAVSLYGLALIYGSTATVAFVPLSIAAASNRPTPVATAGLVMVLAVIAFKIAAVPFHTWAPDAYEGAPIPVAAYLSVVSKTAGFAALTLVLATFASWYDVWAPVIAVVAALTMLLANMVALRQRGAVRLLAWSSIAQAGYVLVPFGAVVAGTQGSAGLLAAVVGYLVAYAAMNLGAFAVVAVVSRDQPRARIADFAGLAWRSPWLGLSLAFFLACLAGLPPGIIGLLIKVQVIAIPVATGAWWLTAAMAVSTVIGLYYYLSWAAVLFKRPEELAKTPLHLAGALPMQLAVGAMMIVTVGLSIAPSLALGLLDRL